MDAKLARAEKITLFVILLLALGLRFYRLGAESFWLDEIGHYRVATAPSLHALFLGVKGHAAAAPLDYLLLRLYAAVVQPETSFLIRLPYALYGVLAVYLIYRLGRQIYSPSVGMASAFALTVSAYHVYYSQEVRFYALSVVFGLLGLLTFFRALEQPTRRNLVTWSLVCLLSLYAHYFLAFQIAIQMIYLVLFVRYHQHEKEKPLSSRHFFVAAGLAILLFLPWPLWANAGDLMAIKAAPLSLGIPFLLFLATLGDLHLVILITGLVFANLFWKPLAWLLLATGFLPFFAALVADGVFGYFYNSRQIIFSLPPLILAASAGAALFGTLLYQWFSSNPSAPEKFSWAGPVALAAFFLLGNVKQVAWFYKENQKPDWARAAAYVLSQDPSSEHIGVMSERDSEELAFNLYGPTSDLQALPLLVSLDPTSIQQFLLTYPDAWIIVSDETLAELVSQIPPESIIASPAFYGLNLLHASTD